MQERIVIHDRADKLLRERLGINPYQQPNYRIVRATGRFEYIGKEQGWCPKYPERGDIWILEKWCPPEQYGSKHDWELADLGPWPRHGDYELMWAFDKVEEFSDHQLEGICWAIEQNRNMTRTTRFSKIKEQEDKAKAAEKERLRAIVRDAAHCLPGEMTTVPTTYTLPKLDIPQGSSMLKGNPNG